MEDITLSHLLITGKINFEETPKVVIQELLKLNKVDTYVEFLQLKFVRINCIPQERDLKYISAFINPNVKWEKDVLLNAWEFTKLMMGKGLRVKFDPDIVGLQTPEYPYSLNNCMLYKICKEWGLPLNMETTVSDMVNYIKLSIFISCNYSFDVNIKNNSKLIRNYICTTIHGSDVFNMDNINERLKAYEENMKKIRFFKRSREERTLIEPMNNIEAIAKFAMDNHLDITYSKCPIIDYYYYFTYGDFADRDLLKIKTISPDQMDINQNFNPIFPHSYYDRKRMRNLLKKKGYNGIINTNDIYGTLEIDYLTDNFHLGWKFKKKNNDSCTVVEKIDVDDISIKIELIAYGNGVSGYSFFTYSELASLYQNYKAFVVPDNVSEMLEENAIQRLINISRNNSELSQVISAVSIRSIKTNKKVDMLIIWHESLTNEKKEDVKRVLTVLLHAGMYMRGWKGGTDSFPYKKRPLGDETETLELENNIYLYLDKLRDEYSTDIGKKVLDLDLYLFSYNNWKKSEDKTEGFTIKERLDMVARGETQRKMTSCYKMSSNWIVSSAYKYMIIFGMPEPFNIYQMKQVSE
jgi:hypothetical protein